MNLNNWLPFLISLNEDDKRIIIALFLILVLVIVLIGLLGNGIAKLMKWQGYAIDHAMWEMVMTKVLRDKRHFRRVAFKKNHQILFKQSWIPMIIAFIGTMVFVIWHAVDGNWSQSLFDRETGISSLFFEFEWRPFMSFMESDFLFYPKAIGDPVPTMNALLSYFVIPIWSIAIVWFFVVVQCYLARIIRVFTLSHSIYTRKLDHYHNERGFIEPQPSADLNKPKN
ncbi:MAG: hypothetical protein LBR37_01135 [Erysipelotrichaceae bacterium]|jgi:hypothetical protein|nr:hypothetical protein [Erysipelotrichaceae bacterium]